MIDFNYWSPTYFAFGKGKETQTGELVRRFGVPRLAQVARHAADLCGARREGGGHTASRQDDEPLRQHAGRVQAAHRG